MICTFKKNNFIHLQGLYVYVIDFHSLRILDSIFYELSQPFLFSFYIKNGVQLYFLLFK